MRRGRPRKYDYVLDLLQQGKILRVTTAQYKAIRRYLSALRRKGRKVTVFYEEGLGGEYRYIIPNRIAIAFGEIVDLTGEDKQKTKKLCV